MSTTNHTTNYELSQYIGTDVTSYLANYNSDMYKIDAQMKVNADDAAEAKSDAAIAVATSTTAASNASAAVSTANAADTTAEAAQTAATAAQTAAGAAQTDAAAALRAAASNTIGNLAPAYDATLTYGVGDLVTYVDPETNQGKLYKNIIPIDVPEEFNINKWDDVTTSEVYMHQNTDYLDVLYEINASGTYNDNMTALKNAISVSDERLNGCKLVRIQGDERRVYNFDSLNTELNNFILKFSCVDINSNGDIYIMAIGLYENSNVFNTAKITIDGTVTNASNLALSDSATKYQIVKTH